MVKKQIMSQTTKKGKTETLYTFSNYTFDNFGNWIGREVVESTVGGDGVSTADKHYIEKRTIKYY